MKITPLDLQQPTFRRSFSGYLRRDVDEFLELIREEWEELLREHHLAQEELDRLRRRVEENEEKERTLKETLMTAQKLTQDLKESAKKEAEIIIGQAELQGEKIIRKAHGRLTEIIDEINQIKRQRAELEGNLRGILEGHLRLLELHDDARDEGQLEDVTVLSAST